MDPIIAIDLIIDDLFKKFDPDYCVLLLRKLEDTNDYKNINKILGSLEKNNRIRYFYPPYSNWDTIYYFDISKYYTLLISVAEKLEDNKVLPKVTPTREDLQNYRLIKVVNDSSVYQTNTKDWEKIREIVRTCPDNLSKIKQLEHEKDILKEEYLRLLAQIAKKQT